MNPRLRRAGAFGAIAVAAIALLVWSRSDGRRIGRALAELESSFEKSGAESSLVALATARSISTRFATGFSIRAEPYEGRIEDSRTLIGAVARVRERARQISVAHSDVDLVVRDNGSADQTLVFRVTGVEAARGPGGERFRARIGWVREDDGEWRILDFEILERLPDDPF